jgi:hypothetical protein
MHRKQSCTSETTRKSIQRSADCPARKLVAPKSSQRAPTSKSGPYFRGEEVDARTRAA